MIIPVEDLPEGWAMTHLIRLGDDDWQIIVRNEHYVVVATGAPMGVLVANAIEKIFLEDFAGPLFRAQEDLLKVPKIDLKNLLENLGLARPLSIPRRNGL